nr:T9SS type A sorting domain-containing protein [uncultured Arsenicibacter sp.]
MKKSLLFSAALLMGMSAAFAQEYPVSQEIARSIKSGAAIQEKAVESIVARNEVQSGASVSYEAGRSIVLQPGFTAQPGAVFEATIANVVSRPAGPEANAVMTVAAAPNPFADQTIVEYRLPESSRVSRTLTDLRGNIIEQTSTEDVQAAGQYKVNVRGGNLPTGIYIYQIQTDKGTKSVRLMKQ